MVHVVGDGSGAAPRDRAAHSPSDNGVGRGGGTDEFVAADRRVAFFFLGSCAGRRGIAIALQLRDPPGKWR